MRLYDTHGDKLTVPSPSDDGSKQYGCSAESILKITYCLQPSEGQRNYKHCCHHTLEPCTLPTQEIFGFGLILPRKSGDFPAQLWGVAEVVFLTKTYRLSFLKAGTEILYYWRKKTGLFIRRTSRQSLGTFKESNPLPDLGGTMDLKLLLIGCRLIFITCNYRFAN